MDVDVGLFGLLILGLDIWAILKTVESNAGTGAKAIWIVLILVLPVVGFLLWLFAGPRR